MNALTPNPYESPQSVTTEPLPNAIVPLSRVLFRLPILAFAGFASFFTFGLLFFVVAETFQLEIFPSIPWAIEIGAVGAVLFLSSEVFTSGKGRQPRFIARFVASIAVFLVSGIVASLLVQPQPHIRGEPDPAWPQRLIVFIAILIPALAVTRLLWLNKLSVSNSDIQVT